MIQEPGMSYLIDWRNFYMLISTAAATLTGLMFVSTTLIAGMDRHISTMNAGITAFNTPTVVHFCAVLMIGGIFVAPWQNLLFVRILLALLGLGGVIYLIVVGQKMKNIPQRRRPLRDWFWYMILPLIAYIVLTIVALMLSINSMLSFYCISLVTLGLLFTGIRNAWDLATYLVIERSHSGK